MAKRDNEMMMTAMMMTTMTMSALKITAMTMMTVEWRAPADGSIGGAAQPQPRSQEMSPLFLLLSSSSPLLTTIISSVRSSYSHPDLLLVQHPPTHFFRSHRSSTLDFHFLSHYSYIKAIMLYKGKTWKDSGIL